MSLVSLFGQQMMVNPPMYPTFDFGAQQLETPSYYHRELSHNTNPNVLNGHKTNLRARRDKKGYCIKYKESQWQHFNRITDRLDAKKNPNYKAGPADFSIAEITELAGLSQQGKYGNNRTPKPSWLDPVATFMWDAWNKKKGMTVKTAREKYINLCKKFCRRFKVDCRNPK